MKFGDVPESAHKDVAERIVRLVKAGELTPAALEDLGAALMPYGAAKWPYLRPNASRTFRPNASGVIGF
jgi:hypothetical protein